MTVLLVAVGGALGAVARLLVARSLPGPRSTLLVNVLGSLLLGLLAGSSGGAYALLGIGFCGAFTTFSAFAADGVTLPRRQAVAYVVATVVLCLLAAELGLLLG